jgi:hypothetical protein
VDVTDGVRLTGRQRNRGSDGGRGDGGLQLRVEQDHQDQPGNAYPQQSQVGKQKEGLAG